MSKRKKASHGDEPPLKKCKISGSNMHKQTDLIYSQDRFHFGIWPDAVRLYLYLVPESRINRMSVLESGSFYNVFSSYYIHILQTIGNRFQGYNYKIPHWLCQHLLKTFVNHAMYVSFVCFFIAFKFILFLYVFLQISMFL